MMLLSSEDQDLRRLQYPYIKRILVQFASMLIRGIAFSIRDREDEVVDPVPIDIVDNIMEVDGANDSDYDAAISNPSLDAAVAYHAIVTTDMNFDSSSHGDNVGSALIRRSIALAEMGLQRSELSLRRSRRLAHRHQQFQEVQRLLQEAIREREREQAIREREEDSENQNNQNVHIVISEEQQQQQQQQQQDYDDDNDDSSPYGLEF
jgi:hypothetical protein